MIRFRNTWHSLQSKQTLNNQNSPACWVRELHQQGGKPCHEATKFADSGQEPLTSSSLPIKTLHYGQVCSWSHIKNLHKCWKSSDIKTWTKPIWWIHGPNTERYIGKAHPTSRPIWPINPPNNKSRVIFRPSPTISNRFNRFKLVNMSWVASGCTGVKIDGSPHKIFCTSHLIQSHILTTSLLLLLLPSWRQPSFIQA